MTQVLWSCDPEERQISKRLWNSFDAEGIPQIRLTGNETLSFGEGSFDFLMGDTKLGTLRLNMAGFSGVINFDPSKSAQWTGSLQVQPWQAARTSSGAQVWVITGENGLKRESGALWAADYRWIQLETDGQQLWFSKK